ncbi:MAG: TusE/DsrC/DsvC family sulfur relay protein [Methylococcales bacterium]|nr:TusE/DsrC/DsvC family sulfur relay protein [Methylococcales bacterium]MDD5753339.1 TusE/DsrC/DsvC family sulfur relay protein [Methylococcales bacterium]
MDLNLTEQGFLVCSSDWNEAVATELAILNRVTLTPAHWEIVLFMREYYARFNYLPNTRIFVKAIANQFGIEKGNSRYLQNLFPESPLKYACLLAGLPKPPTCL